MKVYKVTSWKLQVIKLQVIKLQVIKLLILYELYEPVCRQAGFINFMNFINFTNFMNLILHTKIIFAIKSNHNLKTTSKICKKIELFI